MALERLSDQKVIATNLNGYIQAQLVLLQNQRTQRNLDDEARFQQAVLEDNLSLEDQLQYRTDQLKRVGSDKDERRRLRTEISGLKDLIEADSFTQAYLEKITELNSGAASIDATIDWLTQRGATATDIKIKDTIKQNLSQLKQQKYQLQQDTLSKKTQFAIDDQSESVLDTQIKNVSKERKDALLAGNDNYVSVLDLQLQNLKKSLNETKINKTLMDMSVDTITGQSATGLLDKFNKMVDDADENAPITIGGVRYDNVKAFWNTQRANYLNDNSENGFFGRYSTEINKNVEFNVSRGTFKTDNLKGISDAWDGLKFRPELGGYETRVDQNKQQSMQTAADIRATQVINKFSTDLNATAAVRELTVIQSTYGVDQTLNYQKIIAGVSREKEGQLQSLLQATANIVADTGMSYEQAFAKAVSSGISTSSVYSPEALATKSVEELGKETVTAQNKGPNLGIDQADQANFAEPSFVEGSLYKLKNNPTSYLFQGGQLRPLADQFNEEELRQATGKGFKDINVVDSIGKTPLGANLTKTQLIQPKPQPQQPAAAQPLQLKPITDLVNRRPSAANPKVYEYYRKDNNQGFKQGTELFSYLQSQGYNDIKDFKQVDPYFK